MSREHANIAGSSRWRASEGKGFLLMFNKHQNRFSHVEIQFSFRKNSLQFKIILKYLNWNEIKMGDSYDDN